MEPDAYKQQLELALAFSHFTYAHTERYLLVCDLQGIETEAGAKRDEKIILLTDPAIHCSKHLRFGRTNRMKDGIKDFFRTHRCNHHCKALGITEILPDCEWFTFLF